MKRALFSIAAAALLVAGPALAQSAAVDPEDEARKAFAETDLNGDGKVNREELHRRVVDIFYRHDADKDGFMDAEEGKAHHGGMQGDDMKDDGAETEAKADMEGKCGEGKCGASM